MSLTKPSFVASLVLATLAFPALSSHAQDKKNSSAIRVQVDLQSVAVQVKDSHGNDVLGLSVGDFTILEDGQPQKISFFDAGNDPASLVVLVDSSTTVNSNAHLGSAQAIAIQFMRTARPGDEISAMDFTDQMGPYEHLTPEQLLNPSSVATLPVPGGGSALYDAIATALCHLQASKNLQQAVVVITDGIDQHSRITLEELIGLLRSSRAELFMIDLESRSKFNFGGHSEARLTLVNGQDIDNPVIVFERLMKESGAQSSLPKSERSLEEALKAVSETLRTQYALAYYPQQPSKKLRKIEVRVDRPGVQVFTRRFVGPDTDAAESVHFDDGTCIVSPKLHPYPYESKLTGPSGMIYREDFSDRRSGWPNHGNSHYLTGGYELSNATTFRQNVIAAYGPWWGDFRTSVNVNAVPAPKSTDADPQFPYASRPAAGLVFRFNQDGYYAMLMNGAPGKKELSVKLVRREFQGDSYTEMQIVPWTRVSTKASASATNLSIEVIGNQILMFVDSQEVTSGRDDTFDQGYVGFVVSGPGYATFRDLVVEPK